MHMVLGSLQIHDLPEDDEVSTPSSLGACATGCGIILRVVLF